MQLHTLMEKNYEQLQAFYVVALLFQKYNKKAYTLTSGTKIMPSVTVITHTHLLSHTVFLNRHKSYFGEFIHVMFTVTGAGEVVFEMPINTQPGHLVFSKKKNTIRHLLL